MAPKRIIMCHTVWADKLTQRAEVIFDAATLLRLLGGELWTVSPEINSEKDQPCNLLANIKENLADEKNYFSFVAPGCQLTIEIKLQQVELQFLMIAELFEKYQALIIDYADRLQKERGIFGVVRAETEYLQHNERDLGKRLAINTPAEIAELPKRLNQKRQEVVDVQKFSGYDFFIEGFLFTSCWLMYVSKSYENIVPREIFLEAQQVDEIIFFKDSPQKIIRTKLFNDPFSWDHPANRAFQTLYAQQIGIQYLSVENGVGMLTEPRVEYVRRPNFFQSMQYFDKNFQPAKKSAAHYFLSRTMNYQTGEKTAHLIEGQLNVKAYFPFVDERKSSLVNYQVIQPEKTLDQGISGISYYINLHFNLELVKDYHHYQKVLMIFVPKYYLDKLPTEEIAAQFPEVKIKKRRHKTYTSLNLKKSDQELSVLFAAVEEFSHFKAFKKEL
ncbi:hypothetical protein [Enterococcus timonensis]|uniref:hypothetical protein n=1 Tax=Enterococcus timonensis TaxID=1852364 RepID=UPI0008D96A56|nr:hypothetical protein [Enterococcus timonensis]